MLQYPWRLVGLVFAVALAVALLGAVQQRMCRDGALRGELAIMQARYAEASTQRRVDSVEVVKWVTRTERFRDTINVTDTLQVREYLRQTDTLRVRCLACLTSAAALNTSGDSTIRLLAVNRRRWYDRLGVTVGVGATVRGGLVSVGPQVGLSVRVWP